MISKHLGLLHESKLSLVAQKAFLKWLLVGECQSRSSSCCCCYTFKKASCASQYTVGTVHMYSTTVEERFEIRVESRTDMKKGAPLIAHLVRCQRKTLSLPLLFPCVLCTLCTIPHRSSFSVLLYGIEGRNKTLCLPSLIFASEKARLTKAPFPSFNLMPRDFFLIIFFQKRKHSRNNRTPSVTGQEVTMSSFPSPPLHSTVIPFFLFPANATGVFGR